jgi:hypothetical protein
VEASHEDFSNLVVARTTLEEWLRSEPPAPDRMSALEASAAALTRLEPIYTAMTICMLHDVVRILDDWVVDKASSRESARWGNAASFAVRQPFLSARRSLTGISDRPPITVWVNSQVTEAE